MNRKEAIKILEHSGDYVGLLPSEFWDSDDGICEAIDMAIDALNHQTEFEQIKWERDVALQTLEEHGIGLGQIKE